MLLVSDLRDPANQQTAGTLRIGDAFCCLGRACEVYRRIETPGVEWTIDELSIGRFLGASGLPPVEVAEWYGWGIDVDPNIGTASMASLNDTHCLQFKDIAQELEEWIERCLEEWETA